MPATPRFITAAEAQADDLGDVKGPDTSGDSNIALFDGTTGKLLKAAGVVEGVATIDSTTNILIGDDSGNAVDSGVPVSAIGGGDATLILQSSGDSTDPSTFTADNSGIKQLDVNDVEMLNIFVNGEDAGNSGGNLLITDKFNSGLVSGQAYGNTIIGVGAAEEYSGEQTTAVGNTVVGYDALADMTDAVDNTAIGYVAGKGIIEGTDNVFLGYNSQVNSDASELVIIGSSAEAGENVTTASIAIGANAVVSENGRAVIGDDSITDLYIGSESAGAIFHGKGDAIVFPESDPHVAGAAYWIAGVLTKSTG